MTPPPTSIDGTDITGATIDGQDVQEITIDGQTVFTAGPTDFYLLDDFGDNKLTNRTGSSTTTYNGVTGFQRPDWTINSGGANASNQKLDLPDSTTLFTDINLNFNETITWELKGVDVTQSSDRRNIFGIGLFADGTTFSAGRPRDGPFVSIRPTQVTRIMDTNVLPVVEDNNPPDRSPMDITVKRFSGGSYELIINGTSIGTNTPGTPTTSAQFVGIGKRRDGSTFFLDEYNCF
jgi:hypothetical protein